MQVQETLPPGRCFLKRSVIHMQEVPRITQFWEPLRETARLTPAAPHLLCSDLFQNFSLHQVSARVVWQGG